MRKILSLNIAMALVLGWFSLVHSQETFDLEADLAFTDSEAALAEAEEADERARQEKELQRQAEEEARRQMDQARRSEADAKKRISQLERDEAKARAAREKAEGETQKALQRQEVARNEIQAAELKLQEAEQKRDQALEIKQREEDTHRHLVEQKKQIEAQTKQRKTEEIGLLKDIDQAQRAVKALEVQAQMALNKNESERSSMQSGLAKKRAELFRLAERVGEMESSLSQGGSSIHTVPAAGSRARGANSPRQGNLRTKRVCNVRARPNTAALVVRQLAAGAQVQARALDSKWVQIIGPANEYMSTVCFR